MSSNLPATTNQSIDKINHANDGDLVSSPEFINPPGASVSNATIYSQTLLQDGHFLLLRIGEQNYRWNNYCYEYVTEEIIDSRIAKFLSDKAYRCPTKKEPDKQSLYPTTQTAINEIRLRLYDIIRASEDIYKTLFIKHVTQQQIRTAQTAISTLDGWFLPSSPAPVQPDKNYFGTKLCPITPDPGATHEKWLAFLSDSLSEDIGCIQALQEFFGYALSNDTTFHKTLWLEGESRSGKSLIMKILCKLVKRVMKSSPLKLTNDHGTEGFDKIDLLCFEEFRIDNADANIFLNTFLDLSAFGDVAINPKGKAQYIGPFRAKIVATANGMPNFPNDGPAFANRVLHIHFRETKKEKEDLQLEEKLTAELAGILNWSIEGYKRLVTNGKFTMTQTMQREAGELNKGSSYVAQFIDECIIHDTDEDAFPTDLEIKAAIIDGKKIEYRRAVSCQSVFEEYQGFRRVSNIRHDMDKRTFGERFLRELKNRGKPTTPFRSAKKPRKHGYLNIAVKPWDGQSDQHKTTSDIGHSDQGEM